MSGPLCWGGLQPSVFDTADGESRAKHSPWLDGLPSPGSQRRAFTAASGERQERGSVHSLWWGSKWTWEGSPAPFLAVLTLKQILASCYPLAF